MGGSNSTGGGGSKSLVRAGFIRTFLRTTLALPLITIPIVRLVTGTTVTWAQVSLPLSKIKIVQRIDTENEEGEDEDDDAGELGVRS